MRGHRARESLPLLHTFHRRRVWHNPLPPKIEEALFSSCGAVACMPWLAASWETPLVRVCIVTVHCILITVISV